MNLGKPQIGPPRLKGWDPGWTNLEEGFKKNSFGLDQNEEGQQHSGLFWERMVILRTARKIKQDEKCGQSAIRTSIFTSKVDAYKRRGQVMWREGNRWVDTVFSQLYRKIKSFCFFSVDLKGALNPSRCSLQLWQKIKTVFDLEEAGIGCLYHYCCLSGDWDHEKWHAHVVNKNLKIHDSAGKIPGLQWQGW